MSPERRLVEEPPRLTEDEVKALLDSLAPTEPARREPGQTLWDVIDEIMAQVADEELARIPPPDHIDHVLDGTPLPSE